MEYSGADMSLKATPAVEHVISCSLSELQQLELAALDLHSQCVKRAEREIKQAIAHRGDAEKYRFLIDHREELIRLAKGVVDGRQWVLRFPAEISEVRRRA
jgi:hypothetical protein